MHKLCVNINVHYFYLVLSLNSPGVFLQMVMAILGLVLNWEKGRSWGKFMIMCATSSIVGWKNEQGRGFL